MEVTFERVLSVSNAHGKPKLGCRKFLNEAAFSSEICKRSHIDYMRTN